MTLTRKILRTGFVFSCLLLLFSVRTPLLHAYGINIGQSQNDVTDDPLFASGWPEVDLHLQASSPAVGAGSAEGAPADDAEGRPRDAQPDLGAYER